MVAFLIILKVIAIILWISVITILALAIIIHLIALLGYLIGRFISFVDSTGPDKKNCKELDEIRKRKEVRIAAEAQEAKEARKVVKQRIVEQEAIDLSGIELPGIKPWRRKDTVIIIVCFILIGGILLHDYLF